MEGEQRQEPRFIVAGLRLRIDGRPHEIVDIGVSGVQILCDGDMPSRVSLTFTSDPGMPPTAFSCQGDLVRNDGSTAVYRFTAPLPDWGARICAFSIFNNLALPLFDA